MDAAGCWHGDYRFEPGDAESPVAFTMHLVQDPRGVVSGTVTEGPGGIWRPGLLVGHARRRLRRSREVAAMLVLQVRA